jgi:hypothetical protein
LAGSLSCGMVIRPYLSAFVSRMNHSLHTVLVLRRCAVAARSMVSPTQG